MFSFFAGECHVINCRAVSTALASSLVTHIMSFDFGAVCITVNIRR